MVRSGARRCQGKAAPSRAGGEQGALRVTTVKRGTLTTEVRECGLSRGAGQAGVRSGGWRGPGRDERKAKRTRGTVLQRRRGEIRNCLKTLVLTYC
jgi:hypothetical protein